MAGTESLRVALTAFPALVASAAPSRIDRQLREVAAALAALLSPQEADVMLLEQQAAQDDAVHLLLDTFCRAHAEDHMSDHTKLGSWRLPYVAMLHSHTSLHVPLIKQLELLLHSSGQASLTPVQCSALSTFMLFMNPCQISPPKAVSKESSEAAAGSETMHIDSENVEESRPKPIGNGRVRVLFGWRWEACCRAQSTGHRNGHETMELDENFAERSAGSAEIGKNGWMEQFCGSFLLDSETDILWATRFAASYLRNVAVYWEHVLFFNKETWMVADLAQQSFKNVALVGPLFVAFVPQTMVLFLLWLHQRLDFAFHFASQSLETTATLKKASLLCESLLSCPLGLLLQSTKPSISLSKFFELELRTGSWNQTGIFAKSCHQFLRHVVWGGAVNSPDRNFTSGLLWKEYSGDRARACVVLTKAFLTNQCEHDKESQNGELVNTRSRKCDEDCENLPLLVWLKACEANPVEVFVVQVIGELASGLDLQCGPWLLEAAFECLESQVRLENAVLTHRETCYYAQKCKSRHCNSGTCSAHRLKSCIAALPPSHSVSFERLNKMEKVFMFCWQGDGPFSIDFAVQLLSSFQISQKSGILLKAEYQWSTLLLATWVRFFNVIGAPVLNLQHVVGGMHLESILTHLHTVQQFLTSNTRNFSPDISGFKAAATAMPQLAAITLIESLFTSSTTNLSLKEGFLSTLATTEASPQQHDLSNRFLDILKQSMEPQAHHKTLSQEDGARLFLFPNLLLFHLVDLLSMAAIACPDFILKKWSQFEYKRKWLTVSTKSSTKLLSMASINLEFSERIGKPQKRMFDILLEWVVTLITLRPGSISNLILSPGTLNPGTNAGGIEVGPKALVLVLVVAGLGRETVLGLDSVVENNWKLLLSEVRGGLENGFRRLFFVGRDVVDVGCEVSGVMADMELFLLKLQDVEMDPSK